ncbi:hypothetical protein [Actinomadura nitritigenes]|uniref:hypothetical protein n=1 Tax=Actinomadura nitritigenes TaxID=134602 RepID=UPI003D8C38AA
MSVTREQAEQVLEAIKEKYAHHWRNEKGDPYGTPPQLIENWHWLTEPTPWAILWEEGPFEWAYLAGVGGLDMEVYCLALDEYGHTPEGRAKAEELASIAPVPVPEGLYLEAVTTYAVSVCETHPTALPSGGSSGT